MPRAKSVSRKSTRPMRSSRTARSAPPMTASATPPSSRVRAAAVPASARASRRPSPIFSKTCSAWRASAAAAAASAALTYATTWESRSRKPFRARRRRSSQRGDADLLGGFRFAGVAVAGGGNLGVPPLEKGKAGVKPRAGTQPNRRFRIASKGMPVLRSRQTGDMYVQVVVETPQNLTKKQQELLAEFEKLSSGATQPEAAGFFTKVKDFFGSRASQQ